MVKNKFSALLITLVLQESKFCLKKKQAKKEYENKKAEQSVRL